jgi:hypothetical protein
MPKIGLKSLLVKSSVAWFGLATALTAYNLT